jgi:hypothetical protein
MVTQLSIKLMLAAGANHQVDSYAIQKEVFLASVSDHAQCMGFFK